MITVSATPESTGWVCTVEVRDGGSATTRHQVRVKAEDLQRLGGADAEDLVRRSFEFLLEREPKESILKAFDISEIARYFPEYEEAIRS